MSAGSARGPIVAGDRVSDVLARDESLVEIFAGVAPPFAKLRNRAMRRIMARLVTVEQAARMGGVNTDHLLSDLNAALGARSDGGTHRPSTSPGDAKMSGEARREDPTDAHLSHPMVELDVRDDLRAGREPFSSIMAAVSTLADDSVLHLRTLFEPVPLYAVLGKRGFHHDATAHATDDWSVWFWRPAGDGTPAAAEGRPIVEAGRSGGAVEVDTNSAPNVVQLDVRGLEPPEPLLRTLEALESLPAGSTLVQVNARVPQVLLPILAERGFAYEIDEPRADVVLVRIRHIA
ncbi:MAG TPA: DUF2249 domain-containing protein [Gemmatimonadaceae bacterium]|jgi:hypothetical protein